MTVASKGLLALTFAATVVGCSPLQTEGVSTRASASSQTAERAPTPFDLTYGAALMTSKLYPRLAEATGANANLFISPLSLSQGLGLAAGGARGETLDQMQRLLGWRPGASALVQSYNRQITDTGDPAIAVNIANALWLAEGLPIRQEYLDQSRKDFGALPEMLDFARGSAAAALRINNWVSKETRAAIPKIISPDSLGPDTGAVLTNAVHFKAKWSDPFEDTEQRTFTRGDGTRVPMTMMRQVGRYQYRQSRQGQAIALPYGKDGRFVMEIFLPRDGATLHRWESEMKGADFFAGEQGGSDRFDLSTAEARDVRIILPRFEARFDESVKAALLLAGMTTPFDPARADFSGIAQGVPLAISDVVHATFLRVDEEGTEAAAATAVAIVVTGARVEPDVPEMIVDRPFLAALRDRKSGAILFFGRISNPVEIRQ